MSSRRDFFRQSLLGAAAITAPGMLTNSVYAATTVNREVFKSLPVSVLSYSFHGLVNEGMMDIFGFFETCRFRYNLDTADLWNGMFASTDDDYINKVHRALEERQLVVPNISADGCHLISGPAKDSADNRAMLRSKQDQYMQIAAKLGVGFLRFDAGPLPEKGADLRVPWSDADFDYLVKRYRELAQFAYDNGFKVGAENHMGGERYWTNMEKLIKAVDHPGFGICVHFGGWAGTQEENDFADREAVKYICHTHFPWAICESPQLQEKMKLLRDAGYKGYYSVEHHSAQNEYNLVEVQLSKVRAVLTSWNNGGTGDFQPPRNK